jgi:hypothetical protein
MAEVLKGQTLTPEKKDSLVGIIKSELDNVKLSIDQGKYGDAAIGVLKNNQTKLQKLINDLLAKKGVITPDETNSTFDVLAQSKKDRLQEDYVMGLKRGTFYLVAFGIAAVATYLIVKKSK